MNGTVRVGACQSPEILGSMQASLAYMLQFAKQAEEKSVDLLLFPDCFLSGFILDEAHDTFNTEELLRICEP